MVPGTNQAKKIEWYQVPFSHLSDLTKGIFNIIYPPLCEICGIKIEPETDSALCRKCLGQIKLLTPAVPARCRNTNVWAVCSYEGIARECIHMFKYNARINLAKPLSQLMINFTNNYLKPGKFDIILPVPLHRNRLRERGFNQSELLAKNLARSTNMPIEPKALRRIKPTIAQAGLSRAKRFANLKAAFRVDKSSAVAGKKLLLIDDVFTTGSTLGECAKALLKAKAESVDALVLARGM